MSDRTDRPLTDADIRLALADALVSFRHDPLGFVRWAFPWGEEGGPLATMTGPDDWQEDTLIEIGREVAKSGKIRLSTASGKGIGKSATVAWLILWAMMTSPYTRGVVTANTDGQLKTKTWPEATKWFNMLMPELRAQFAMTATALYSKSEGAERTWRMDAIPWSEKNPEAFAGLHNQGRRILVVFDEASSIADNIWDTTDGIMSDRDTEVIWAAFGNPTRNDGMFRETFRRFAEMWMTQKIDSRTVAITDKEELNKLVRAYGEDDDYTRVYVKGDFPRSSVTQFIADDVVEAAVKRDAPHIPSDPLIFGLDVARFGDDKSVLAIRKGRDAKSIPWKSWRGANTMELASAVIAEMNKYKPDAVFVDVSGGLGAGPADRMRQMGFTNVYDVNFGGGEQIVTFDNGVSQRAFNPVAAMWLNMREWMEQGSIPDLPELKRDLTGRYFGYSERTNALRLERKQDMKARGIPSCDFGDALCLTWAFPIAPRNVPGFSNDVNGDTGVVTSYDPYSELR